MAGQAQVVGVVAAVAFGLGVDQPGGAALGTASFAIQQAFEVVVVDAVALSSCGAVFDDFLHAFEQIG
ncbi:hypothetical protein UG54_02085 [Gordonia sihwensis]|nr:hypothetical protein UG54_02085 [Gordonia sihwensis]